MARAGNVATRECWFCGGEGWITDHDPRCSGDPVSCERACPVQALCPRCLGAGVGGPTTHDEEVRDDEPF